VEIVKPSKQVQREGRARGKRMKKKKFRSYSRRQCKRGRGGSGAFWGWGVTGGVEVRDDKGFESNGIKEGGVKKTGRKKKNAPPFDGKKK